MGLVDALNSVQGDPSEQRAFGSGSSGMSPLTMALLGLLAYRRSKASAVASQAQRPQDQVRRPVLIRARLAPELVREISVIC